MFVVVEVDFVVIGHGIVTHVTVAAGVASIEVAVELLVVDAMLIVEGGGVVVDGAGDSLVLVLVLFANDFLADSLV